jgi:HSP20 family protein
MTFAHEEWQTTPSRAAQPRLERRQTMALVRWEPFGGLTSLRREMERLFEDFLERRPFHLGELGVTEPAVEVSDTKDAVVVKAQVPGISQENIQLSVTENALTLKGELKEEETKEDKNYHQREFHYGAFSRTVSLPTAVQAEQATATLKDGVLEVTIPKSEETKVKEIPIQT